MSVLIDPPSAPGPGGGLYSHLASDVSRDELHDFAARAGIPRRAFDGDHYDVPAVLHDRLVRAGAQPVSSRELVARLTRGGLRRRRTGRAGRRPPGRSLLSPPRLGPGSRVVVVAPAGPTDDGRVEAGIEVLRSWGLAVDAAPEPAADRSAPWLAAGDEARAADLQRAWTAEGVDAVWCTRGGFGCHRMIDLLGWSELLDARPRLLVGFSDVTALHEAFAARLGLATVHGAGVATLAGLDDDAREATRALVLDGVAPRLAGRTLVPGSAVGPVAGGNLTVLAAGAGTPTARPAHGALALLEDVGEAPYRLDRALTQLLRAGWFDGVAGVACGGFTDCGEPDRLRELLRDRLGGLGVPVVTDLPVGHEPHHRPVVLGARAELEADATTGEGRLVATEPLAAPRGATGG